MITNDDRKEIFSPFEPLLKNANWQTPDKVFETISRPLCAILPELPVRPVLLCSLNEISRLGGHKEGFFAVSYAFTKLAGCQLKALPAMGSDPEKESVVKDGALRGLYLAYQTLPRTDSSVIESDAEPFMTAARHFERLSGDDGRVKSLRLLLGDLKLVSETEAVFRNAYDPVLVAESLEIAPAPSALLLHHAAHFVARYELDRIAHLNAPQP